MEHRIKLWPSCFMFPVEMIINVPCDMDAEEFIDSYLDSLLKEDLKYNCEWEFV